MQILIRTLKRKKFLTRRYHWSKKRFLRNLSRVSLRKTWYRTNHDRSINETSPGRDRTKSKRILMILAETTDLAALTTISDGLVKPIEWAIEQLDLARLRARIVANIGSKLLLLPATLPPSTPSWPIQAKTCVHPIQEGGQLRYTLRKLSLQCSKSSLRSVTWLRTPAITGNPRIRSNPEPVHPPPYFPNYSVCEKGLI